jgi:hypothetical protein
MGDRDDLELLRLERLDELVVARSEQGMRRRTHLGMPPMAALTCVTFAPYVSRLA